MMTQCIPSGNLTWNYYIRRRQLMGNVLDWIKVLFAAIGGYLGFFLGGWDGFLYALTVFVVLDYLTGVLVAITEKKLSSEVGFKGICRKVLIFVLVGVGHIIDTQIIGTGGVVRTAVIFFYVSNEGISILENAAHLGLPIPQKLKDVLAQLKESGDKNDGAD